MATLNVAKRPRGGFTLVELLVVVAIIAVLVALLMPALGKARRQARQVACLSNLRQIAVQQVTYASDYSGGILIGYIDSYSRTTSHRLWDATGWNPDPTLPYDRGGPVAMGYMYIAGYMKKKELYYCPAANTQFIKTTYPVPADKTAWPPGDWPNKSFANQFYWMGYATRPSKRWAQFDPATHTPPWPKGGMPRLIDMQNQAIVAEKLTMTPIHEIGLNVVYADGSGLMVPIGNYAANMTAYNNSKTDTLILDTSKTPNTGVWGDFDASR